MLTNIWTRTKAISKWTFSPWTANQCPCARVLLMDKVRNGAVDCTHWVDFVRLIKYYLTIMGQLLRIILFIGPLFSICSCLFVSLYLTMPLHWEWLILITLWNTSDKTKGEKKHHIVVRLHSCYSGKVQNERSNNQKNNGTLIVKQPFNHNAKSSVGWLSHMWFSHLLSFFTIHYRVYVNIKHFS